MAAANDLRPVQARGTLELMMRRQLELRRRETETLHAKCDSLEAKLSKLRESMQDLPPKSTPLHPTLKTLPVENVSNYSSGNLEIGADETPRPDATGRGRITQRDILRWAEEIG